MVVRGVHESLELDIRDWVLVDIEGMDAQGMRVKPPGRVFPPNPAHPRPGRSSLRFSIPATSMSKSAGGIFTMSSGALVAGSVGLIGTICTGSIFHSCEKLANGVLVSGFMLANTALS